MEEFNDKVRDAQITNNFGDRDDFYKTLYYKGSFYVYKHVNEKIMYKGDRYHEEGYILAWADHQNPNELFNPPAYISRRPKSE